MPPRPTHIVDASALIAYFKGESGQEKFAELLRDERNAFAIHATNLGELYYIYLRFDGLEKAEEAWTRANEIAGVIERVDTQFIKRMARWKVNHGLPLGDAFAAATAEEYGCPLIMTDHNDFGPIEAASVLQIVWLR